MPARVPTVSGGFLGATWFRWFGRDPLGLLDHVRETCGPIALTRMGPIAYCFVNDPALAHEALVTKAKSFTKEPRLRRVLRTVDGDGLLVSEGSLWMKQRRMLQPAFHRKRITGYATVMVEQSALFFQRWAGGGVRDIRKDMIDLAIAVAAQVFFGADLTGSSAGLGVAVQELSFILFRKSMSAVLLPEWVPTPLNRRLKRARTPLLEMVDGLIAARRKDGGDRGDLLSMLLLAVDEEGDGKGMNDKQARDEIITAFNAGHDTTAGTLSWFWNLMAEHQDVQDALAAHARKVLGQRAAEFGDLPALQPIEAAIKETQRLYPAAWSLFGRKAIEDVELGGYTIPAGTQIAIFPWIIQRHAKFWPQPEKFDPARFAPENAAAMVPHAWLPFGLGPHVCIGQQFALTEMTLAAAMALRSFKVSRPEGVAPPRPLALITLQPDRLELRVSERTGG